MWVPMGVMVLNPMLTSESPRLKSPPVLSPCDPQQTHYMLRRVGLAIINCACSACGTVVENGAPRGLVRDAKLALTGDCFLLAIMVR